MSDAKTLIERLCELAELRPDVTAISCRGETLTYAELLRLVRRAAASMSGMGAMSRDVVIVAGVSEPKALACYVAAQAAGCVPAFSYHHATSESLAAICELTSAALFVAGSIPPGFCPPCPVVSPEDLVAPSDEARDGASRELRFLQEDAEAPAEILFTTGTTGAPKAVVLSRRAIRAITRNTIEGTGILPDDRVLVPLPINHSLALRVVRAALWLGATVVLQSGFSSREETERNICERACTGMVTVPAAIEMDRKRFGERFCEVYGRLRYLEIGSGPLPVQARSRLVCELPKTRIVSTWGSTETGGVLFSPFSELDSASEEFGASGQPASGAEVATMDLAGSRFVATAENPGRLALRGDMVMSGYLGRPQLSSDVFAGDWYVTNDLAYVDASGSVHIVGRADDMINVGGEKVFPAEIESALSECLGVRECACVGVDDPDGVRGQVPVAFVVAEEAFDEDACDEWLRRRLEGYKVPHALVRIDRLPRNRMMKLDRPALRELWKDGLPPDAALSDS